MKDSFTYPVTHTHIYNTIQFLKRGMGTESEKLWKQDRDQVTSWRMETI